MARYLERAENTARMVNVNAHLLLDLPKKLPLGWAPLIEITGSTELFAEIYPEANERNVVRFLIADTRNPGSLLNSLASARENARTIRDIIPRESWEIINAVYLDTRAGLPAGLAQKRRFEFLNSIMGSIERLNGLFASTMLHDAGYSFLRMGRNLERADMTTRIVDVRSESLFLEGIEELPPFEHIQWMSVLQSLSAYQSYAQKVQGPVRRQAAVRFLLQDPDFPRAFLHCSEQVKSCLQSLPNNEGPVRFVNRISRIRRARTDEMEAKQLHDYIDRLQLNIARLDGLITKTYFAYE
jgi:uncharacterized alpha-E superfamily protein